MHHRWTTKHERQVTAGGVSGKQPLVVVSGESPLVVASGKSPLVVASGTSPLVASGTSPLVVSGKPPLVVPLRLRRRPRGVLIWTKWLQKRKVNHDPTACNWWAPTNRAMVALSHTISNMLLTGVYKTCFRDLHMLHK